MTPLGGIGRGSWRRGRSGRVAAAAGWEREDYGAVLERRALPGPLVCLCFLLLVLALAGILDYGVLPAPLKEGDRASMDFIARVNFSYMDLDWIKERRRQAAEEAPPVYRPVRDWQAEVLRELKLLCEVVQSAGNADEAVAASMDFPKPLAAGLFAYNAERGPQTLTTILIPYLETVLRGIARNGVLDERNYLEVWRRHGERGEIVRLDESGAQQHVKVDTLLSLAKARTALERSLQAKNLPEDLFRALNSHVQAKLRHNLERNEELSHKLAQAARDRIPNEPRTIEQDTVLLAKDDPVNPEVLRKLQEEARAYKAALPWRQYLRHLAGLCTLAAAVVFFCGLGLLRLEPSREFKLRPLLMLGLTGLAVLAASKALMLNGLPRQLAPVALLSMLASLAFSQGVALVTTFSLALLAGVAAGGDLALSLVLAVGGVASAIGANDLQQRWDLLRHGLGAGLVQALAVAGLSQLHEGGLLSVAGLSQLGFAGMPLPVLSDAPWAFLNGAACGLLVLGLLPLAETAFGIITNIRLFELSDQNQPALRKIMLEAPGTWAHSLQVAFLSEPAAEAIGANARLVRAGVYYHDLGKTLKPEYYVENQLGAEERHRRLAPSVSALIITSHVKDGIELAREFGLPRQIVAFIPEHHGTTLVSYFFHSARRKAREEREGDQGNVQEAFFRYPGPKPQSRETAIVMLADTIEAATRVLEAPSATRLRTFVHELIMQKLLDGQLDECDLTFRDLALIEEVFLRVLVSRFHHRVRYPGQEEPLPSTPTPTGETTALAAAATAALSAPAATASATMPLNGSPVAVEAKSLTETKIFPRQASALPPASPVDAAQGGRPGAGAGS